MTVDSSAPVKVFLSVLARLTRGFVTLSGQRWLTSRTLDYSRFLARHDDSARPRLVREDCRGSSTPLPSSLAVSPAFNASGYIQGVELALGLGMARHPRRSLIPIFVKPVGAMDLLPFAAIQALPIDGRLRPVSELAERGPCMGPGC